MKEGIKVLIAMFFVLSSFYLGRYFDEDDFKEQLTKARIEINKLKKENGILQDSLLKSKEIKPLNNMKAPIEKKS